MGTTTTHYRKGLSVPEFFYGTTVTKTPEGWNEHTNEGYGGTEVTQVAASGLVDRTEFYAVIRFKNKFTGNEFGPWFLAVYLVGWNRKDDWGHNFHYKDMEECMGPNADRCPLKVLKAAEQLCPIPPIEETVAPEHLDAYTVALAAYVAALEGNHRDDAWEMYKVMGKYDRENDRRMWRERCYARIEERRGRTKVKAGDIIQFQTPIKFTSGDTLDTFQVDYSGMYGSALILKRPGSDYGHYRITKWRQLAFEVIDHKETPQMWRRIRRKEELQEKVQQFRAEGYPDAKIVRGYIDAGERQWGII